MGCASAGNVIMPVQLIAIRTTGGESLSNISEVIWRDDLKGTMSPCSTGLLAEWIRSNPEQLVYVRDYLGRVARVRAEIVDGTAILVSGTTNEGLDVLLLLPRYST